MEHPASKKQSLEPWLRGLTPGLHPVVSHLLRSAEQIREDLTRAIAHLTADELWRKPHATPSAGFHARHLAGSTGRLCTYLAGGQLSDDQLAELALEQQPGASASELIQLVDSSLRNYEAMIRDLHPHQFGEVREVGRQRLPVTAIGLAIHIVEHGQRHAGQAMSIGQVVRGKT